MRDAACRATRAAEGECAAGAVFFASSAGTCDDVTERVFRPLRSANGNGADGCHTSTNTTLHSSHSWRDPSPLRGVIAPSKPQRW